MSDPTSHHIPILLEPITEFLAEGVCKLPTSSTAGVILDCTLGGGGHAARLLQKINDRCAPSHPHTLLGFDRDPDAIARNKIRFAREIEEGKLELVHSSFGHALDYVKDRPIYGILADLGISSDQIDSQTRGFSFRYPAPLDMRMNPTTGVSLAQYLEDVSESELSEVIWKYGEERFSRKIARKLVELRTRGQLPRDSAALAEAIASVFPPPMRYKRMHPATQTFQALRIVLNDELKELELLLSKILPSAASGAPIAILSFHSLEDRMVKETLRNQELYELPQRKAIQASDEEIEMNSRSRSAKLRLAFRK